MSISATIGVQIGYTRTVEGEFVSSGNNDYTINGMDFSETLDADSTPAVTDGTEFSIPLVAGAKTIDLTALLEDDGVGTWTALGLKVQGVTFRNPAANAGSMVIIEGAANGHPVLGATFKVTLLPGQSLTLLNEGVDAGTDVAAGDKTWDITGTGTEEIEIGLVVG